ncbi:hypothetical protein GUITHDRAFT_79169 [Guillardia theta CCMP2712]|uniref:Uncharacterized protein n=1 Tax=Guillardia theta (strain CCMP2712) TaxID=905079 RepID=L1IJE9_GUITC|nr:hypothetical protein GUITHDRAFT_79169 [Guillardia theta CCMP2712]EKX36054.1 hypothetical protein GUITHDRAFT_79169 [Guillardia theta CCMP2712]|eukprot:XP_005823034.1 hypothetical protein GUITHDRAFT_79169 [Guillardia theta CCMP2712]
MKVQHAISEALGDVGAMLDEVVGKLKELGIDLEELAPDHVCYRCSSTVEYQDVCAMLSQQGVLLIESMIGGRPISTFQLHGALEYDGWRIGCIEVPCPKEGRAYKSGWEHVEFVVCKEGEHKGNEQLLLWKEKYPHVPWDLRALGKEVNPDISLQVSEQHSCKFHQCPLDRVIEKEKEQKLFVPVPPGYFSQLS